MLTVVPTITVTVISISYIIFDRFFIWQQHSIHLCLARYAIARPSVSLSVRHTGGSVENGSRLEVRIIKFLTIR